MVNTEQKLERSKDRLRKAFAQLEDALERRIKTVEARARSQISAAQQSGDLSVLRQEMDKINMALRHAKEEQRVAQESLGEEQERSKKFKALNQQVAHRVDSLINKLRKEIKE